MASALWQGRWTAKARVVSGLVLFVYVLFHFINVGLGLFSLDAMERFQEIRQMFSRSAVGGLILYGALLTHAGLALYRLARRRTLRMPVWEGLQIVLGLTIPLLLMAHFVHTRVAHEILEVNDHMGFLVGLLWNSNSGWNQALLLLVVWTHACIGLHFWLRITHWWRKYLPLAIAAAALIPAFALAGFMVQGRIQHARLFSQDEGPALAELYNFPSREGFALLADLTNRGLLIFAAILAVTAAIYVGRKLMTGRNSLEIRYVDGPEIHGQRGMTLLEMSRAAGVPHMALCGGRGRCTTCRVIVEDGMQKLEPPSPQEEASLRAVNAPPNARLACQMRPTDPTTVLRVFRADGRRRRDHQSLGQERRLAILFLDMRGFTARTTGQLPYDVVFLLNRFFDAIVPSITGAGGIVDKYLGDGLLAVFDLPDEEQSARAALSAAAGIGSALETFNATLRAEKSDPLKIGIGLHLGDLVIGEIGAAENAPRTIIGDTVNAASRLESETKVQGVELLVSESLLRAAGYDADKLDLIPLELRGVSKPVSALPVDKASALNELLRPGLVELTSGGTSMIEDAREA